MGNLSLSVLIFMSAIRGVYYIPEPSTDFHKSVVGEKNNFPWHWILVFESGQEGNLEEGKKGDELKNAPSKVFSAFLDHQGLTSRFAKSSEDSPDNGIRLNRLFILFNCLRLDPF